MCRPTATKNSSSFVAKNNKILGTKQHQQVLAAAGGGGRRGDKEWDQEGSPVTQNKARQHPIILLCAVVLLVRV